MWWLVLVALVIGIVLGVVYAKWTTPEPVAPLYVEPVKEEMPPHVAAAEPVTPVFYYHPVKRGPERRV